MTNYFSRFTLTLCFAILLSGCSLLDKLTQSFNPQESIQAVNVPPAWQAPMPHDGQVKNLSEFWQRYPNPVLVELIELAQREAPDVATAVANLTEARANRIRAVAELMPKVDATLNASRSLQQPKNTVIKGGGGAFGFANTSPTDTMQANLQASWELDLYGARGSIREATIAEEHAANAAWHEARVSVAAEVAASYFNYLLCRKQSETAQSLLDSYTTAARLTETAFKAGFRDAGEVALAIANLADAKQQHQNQTAQCEIEIKNLTALTYLTEDQLRRKMHAAEQNTPALDLNKLFVIEEVPANALRQRPDIYRAEVALIRAAANVKQAAADRLPGISLQGSIGYLRSENQLFISKGRIWSLGPIQLTLPIFDGGALKATQEASEARYREAAALYRGAIQKAVQETETALVNLHDTGLRQDSAAESIGQLTTHLDATINRERAGFASKLEVEEARRSLLQAKKNALTLQQARANAWLSLYRAAGGGWQPNNVNDASITPFQNKPVLKSPDNTGTTQDYPKESS